MKKAIRLYYKVDKKVYPFAKHPDKWLENQYQNRFFWELTNGTWKDDSYKIYNEYMYKNFVMKNLLDELKI